MNEGDEEIREFFEDETRPLSSCNCPDYFQCMGNTVHDVRNKPHVLALKPASVGFLKKFVSLTGGSK